MSIHQFFILSPRGDSIITKDFRGDAPANMHDAFFHKVKFWDKGDCPPIFEMDGLHYLFIRRNSLLIVCTTRFNISPSNTLVINSFFLSFFLLSFHSTTHLSIPSTHAIVRNTFIALSHFPLLHFKIIGIAE